MAKIIKTDIQETALKVIRENIKTLTGINAVLNSRETDCRILVVAGKRKVSLLVEQSFRDNVLKEIRKKMVAQTEALAKKNAIKLDEEDMAVLKNIDGEGLSKDIFHVNAYVIYFAVCIYALIFFMVLSKRELPKAEMKGMEHGSNDFQTDAERIVFLAKNTTPVFSLDLHEFRKGVLMPDESEKEKKQRTVLFWKMREKVGKG